jgi:F-type H+-transporting ATPase subunit b
MTRNRRLLLISSLLLVVFSAAFSAHAAGEGGNAAMEHSTELFKWINFALVAGVVLWVCLKKAPAFFSGRAEAIGSAITKATNVKAAADAQLREAESKLGRLQQEIVEFRAAAQRDAAAEVDRLRNLTQSDAQKIAAAGRAEITAAERSARLELKAITAKLAVDGAESLLVRQLTPAAQESLISNFVKNVDRFAVTKNLEGRPN